MGAAPGGDYTAEQLWPFDEDTCECDLDRPVGDYKLAVKVSIVFTPSIVITDIVALGNEVRICVAQFHLPTKNTAGRGHMRMHTNII